jgi:hypothetical protein
MKKSVGLSLILGISFIGLTGSLYLKFNQNEVLIKTSSLKKNQIKLDQVDKMKPLSFNRLKQTARLQKNNPPRSKRKIIDHQFKQVKDDQINPDDLIFVNQYNPNWPKEMAKHHFDFLPSNYQYEIKELNSITLVSKKYKARMAEEVLVTMTDDQGISASYRAIVDSQTGLIIKSWGATNFENRDHYKQASFKITH